MLRPVGLEWTGKSSIDTRIGSAARRRGAVAQFPKAGFQSHRPAAAPRPAPRARAKDREARFYLCALSHSALPSGRQSTWQGRRLASPPLPRAHRDYATQESRLLPPRGGSAAEDSRLARPATLPNCNSEPARAPSPPVETCDIQIARTHKARAPPRSLTPLSLTPLLFACTPPRTPHRRAPGPCEREG